MPQRGADFAISAPSIFDGAHFFSDHCVTVRDGLVTQLLPLSDCPTTLKLTRLNEGTLAPGFIDLQVNGGGDVMFNDAPDANSIERIVRAHRARGTTALLPTLISDTQQAQRLAVDAVRAAIASGQEGVLGIHLEGPYFAEIKRGAHHTGMIRKASTEDIAWLCSLKDLTVIVTLAPEVMAAGQLNTLCDAGLIVCAGHTAANHAQLQEALSDGLSGVTHLFNAMTQLSSREPGTVGAALELDELWAGIIADGHHVHPASIRLAHRLKPAGKLILVSDAMATVGGKTGAFSLYDETIREQGGRLISAAGALAGSAIGLIDAVRYSSTEVGIELGECLRMASLYPATVLGIADQRGKISEGFRADLVHFDESFIVRNTWVAGQQRAHA